MISSYSSIPAQDDVYLDAQDIFYKQFNDVDIYVEDVDQEDFYKQLFVKILPYKIGKIFPLKGKSKVIIKAKENPGVKGKVFVVDKDFDDLHGTVEAVENLFYLNKYCIENYLITKAAFLKFIKDEFPKLSYDTIDDNLNFDNLYKKSISELTDLFINFYLIQKIGLPIENCSCAIDKYISDKTNHEIDSAKCCKLFDDIKLYSEVFGVKVDIYREKREIEVLYSKYESAEPHIPGKHLLFLFVRKMNSYFKIPRLPNKDSLCFRLAGHSDFDNLSFLKNKIIAFQDK